VTFTAPSFGKVHTRKAQGAGCYDAQAQVLSNALAPELWRRTTIALPRALARLVSLQETELRRVAWEELCTIAA
jgi:hypothetical protein